MIRVIGFDYGGVIAGYHAAEFNQTMAETLGVEVESYLASYDKYKKNSSVYKSSDIFELIARDFAQPETLQQMIDYVDAKPREPNPEIISIFKSLQNKGISLGLLTNASPNRRKTLQEYGLEQYFDVIDISSETGLIKPDEEAYIHLSKQFRAKPSEIVYVDDVQANLGVPDVLGWNTIYYKNPSDLRKMLIEQI